MFLIYKRYIVHTIRPTLD